MIKSYHCVIPEDIHTHPKEELEIAKGEGGFKSQNF